MNFVFENKPDLTVVNGSNVYKIKIDIGVKFHLHCLILDNEDLDIWSFFSIFWHQDTCVAWGPDD